MNIDDYYKIIYQDWIVPKTRKTETVTETYFTETKTNLKHGK